QERKVMSAILVAADPGVPHQEICRRIEESTRQRAERPGLKALTRDEFIWSTLMYFGRRTRIIVHFRITRGLGFHVGCAIAGQTFYTFTLENLNQFGSLKAMGLSNLRIIGMVLVQALVVGLLGYGLGVGAAALFGQAATSGSKLAFYMPWQVLVGTA